jgi:transcriptional regulator with XRE-family HTH domain
MVPRVATRSIQSLIAGIRARRLDLGLSQERLALAAGVHRNTVRLLESGQTDTTVLTLTRVLRCLGTTALSLDGQRVVFRFQSQSDPAGVGVEPETRDPKALLSILGGAIALRRRELGLSQEQLAERADLHANTIGMIERAEHDPTLSTVMRLYEAMDVHEIEPCPGWLRIR